LGVKQWNVGDILAAADMNSWTVPLAAVATGSQAVTGTTGTADNTLSVAVAANAIYSVELYMRVEGTASTAFVASFNGPSGSTFSATYANAAATNDIGLGSVFGIGSLTGPSTAESFVVVGTLNTAGTAGNLSLQFAAGGAGNTVTRLGNSRLVLQRIS
jgi:hypothetical protein